MKVIYSSSAKLSGEKNWLDSLAWEAEPVGTNAELSDRENAKGVAVTFMF